MKRWKVSVAMTDGELIVIRALLPQADPRSALLFAQASDAPEVRRAFVGQCGYRASIPYVKTAKYLTEVPVNTTSPSLVVGDRLSSRELAFSVAVLRGGFLSHLEGTALDGRAWPIEWVPNVDLVSMPNWLPRDVSPVEREQELQALANWAGLPADTLLRYSTEVLRVKMPASAADIASCEARCGCAMPSDYKEFVSICNGVSVLYDRPYEVYGTEDVYWLELAGGETNGVVVTSLYEDGVVVLKCGDGDAGTVGLIGPGDTEVKRIGGLRDHVRESLTIGHLGTPHRERGV